MGQFGSQVTVVGEEQHTRRVPIETTYRVDTFVASVLHDVQHRQFCVWIVVGSDAVFWFVQQEVDPLVRGNQLVVDHDLVATENLCSQFADIHTVNRHNTSLDQFVSLTT